MTLPARRDEDACEGDMLDTDATWCLASLYHRPAVLLEASLALPAGYLDLSLAPMVTSSHVSRVRCENGG